MDDLAQLRSLIDLLRSLAAHAKSKADEETSNFSLSYWLGAQIAYLDAAERLEEITLESDNRSR